MGQVAQRLGFVEFVNVDTLAKESIVAEDKVRVWVYGGDGIYSEDVVDPDMRDRKSVV